MGSQLSAVRKKILIISTNADWAGAPIHVLTLVTRLEADFDLFIVFGEDGPVRQALLEKSIPSTVVPTLRSSINFVRDFQCLLAFLRIVRSERPALLHAHSSKAGMIARLAAYALRLPCLYTVHGWGFGAGRAKFQSSIVYGVERMLSIIPRTSYIFVSNADRHEGLERLGLNPNRCLTVHNGIRDHGCLARVEHNSNVIMVARVCHAKDHDLLLESYQNSITSFRLVLVGEGTDSPGFRKRVLSGTPDKYLHVDCLGLSRKVPQLLAQAGVFVLCSRYEGLPLAIIEAMCAGLPIVASDVGGVRELVEDGVNGFLVPAGNHTALTRCLDRLQGDPALRIRMGHASRARYLASFSDTQMAACIAQRYLTMIDAE
ncbi:glycosyltransferase family 4 protein [Rhodoferax sp. AJA081-3]|uniref:glycosyltransferase family 4 protein n=1 Tax=Rhodoferax sp. AJA081-3 TaxID=2752316 RepID=UPI001ADEDB3A|nr:glycosyltransferase family 4 protein [Rhodoferax sp. AJA081-3]QTN26755.1 glycosyltransferase family 4 protein [Rhodoferax sp. AJA081-3]